MPSLASCTTVFVIDTETTPSVLSGTWTTSTSVPPFNGANYVTNGGRSGSTNRFALFSFSGLGTAQTYHVFVSYSASANRETAVEVLVNHDGGQTTFAQNQQLTQSEAPTSSFDYLTTQTFTSTGSVRINTFGASSIVTADAVAFCLA